jgi:dipeptidyl aminopeptidase/acylaminoacyl peptidase
MGFESANTNLPGGLGPSHDQVYIRNRESGKTALVSKNTAGSPADSDSGDIMVSANGRFAGFESLGSNLPGGGIHTQAYLRDRKKSKTILVSQSSGGAAGSGGESEDASVSDNGRFVAFESEATNLGGLTTGEDQVFIRDRKDGKTRLASKANDGSPANDDSYLPRSSSVLTSDGGHVVFYSYGSNLPGSIGPVYEQVYIRGPLP